MTTLALEVRNVRKEFSGVEVLHGVNFDVHAGEIHALLGGNGAGKSTLVKVITGVISPEPGASVRVFGNEIALPHSRPHQAGIAVIHQDLGLVDTMTVAENMGVSSSFGVGGLGLKPIPFRRERAQCMELLREMELDIDVSALVGTLAPSERAGLAIARARRLLAEHAERFVFILDEPTAYLNTREADRVIALMRHVAASGSAVVFVSHRLNEVSACADRITVLRDGAVADTFTAAEGDRSRVIAASLGRELREPYPSIAEVIPGEVSLQVRSLSGARVVDLNFDLRAGEIVGMAGLVGMGHEDVPVLLGGGETSTGTISLDGTDVSGESVRERIDRGIVLVPGNRARDGLWPDGTAAENTTLPDIVARPWKRLRLRTENARARERLMKFGVTPPDPRRLAVEYSGGNQQKIVLSKWLTRATRLIALDEPTQGVDVGAKFDLLSEVVDAARTGSAVLISSGDYEQLAAICHRILILRDGRITHELTGPGIAEREIAEAVFA